MTGGTGYIGSHTCVELLNAGYEPIVYDNLSNSKAEVIKRIEAITGKQLTFIQGDIRDTAVGDGPCRAGRPRAVRDRPAHRPDPGA